jgi:Fe-S cluster biosynthesis and repair protein YggX
MTQTVKCSRCGQENPGVASVPYPGELGRQLRETVCASCWEEWERMEVMVINELRLNFMEPKSMEILQQHLRDFFFLPGASGETVIPGPEGPTGKPGPGVRGDGPPGDSGEGGGSESSG